MPKGKDVKMAFDDNRKELREAVQKSETKFSKSEAPNNIERRLPRSYTLRPDVIDTVNQVADEQHVSASHLVEEILVNHFKL